MREIIFDTETTGLDPRGGDRVVEIGCVELVNHIPSGETFHRYVNPERAMPAEAAAVHGLDDAFLRDKPVFATIADELVDFFGDAKLIAHNAEFDQRFLNMEFAKVGHASIPNQRVVDTLAIAKRRFPGSPASLDALCARFQIDTSRRTLHGALLDAELLAEVYIELIGGRQASLGLMADVGGQDVQPMLSGTAARPRPEPRLFRIEANELEAHQLAVSRLGENALWQKYAPKSDGSAVVPTAV